MPEAIITVHNPTALTTITRPRAVIGSIALSKLTGRLRAQPHVAGTVPTASAKADAEHARGMAALPAGSSRDSIPA